MESNESGFPWALLYLERMIRHLDVEVLLIDERLNKDYIEIINSTKGRLLFAGVSSIVGYQIVGGIKFSENIKMITGAPVIWGGWFPTVFPEMILQDGYADYVCIGQGEIPFLSFTEKLIAGEEITAIAGIGYKKNGTVIINPLSKLVDPDKFPRINLSLININQLIELHENTNNAFRDIDYLASTGCPHNCSFCNMTIYIGSRWFPKKISEIIDDLKYLREEASITHISFWDDNFFASKKFVLDFCNELILSGLKMTWDAETHVGFFLKTYTDEDIQLMYKSGCRRIKVGAESGDQEVLDLVNKRNQVKENLQIVKVLKKHNIRIRYLTMLCFPNNPDRDFWLTLNMIGKALIIDQNLAAIITFYKPIPKTPLYKLCEEKGFVSPSTTKELITSLSNKSTAPWYKRDYHKELDNYLNFYFLFLNPRYYKTFPLKYKPFIFILNMFLFPLIYFRFKFNLMKFPIEAKLFKRVTKSRKEIMFFDTISVNKSRILK